MRPEVHYGIHNSPSYVPILSKIDPVPGLPPSFFKMHFRVILSPTPRYAKKSPSFRFPHHHTLRTSPLLSTIGGQSIFLLSYYQYSNLTYTWCAVT